MALEKSNTETMTQYETKTIMYSENGPGAYTIMMTKMDVKDGHPLRKVGYRGRSILYMVLASIGVQEGSHDARRVANSVSMQSDNSLRELLTAIDRSDEAWEAIEDGQRFIPAQADEFAERFKR